MKILKRTDTCCIYFTVREREVALCWLMLDEIKTVQFLLSTIVFLRTLQAGNRKRSSDIMGILGLTIMLTKIAFTKMAEQLGQHLILPIIMIESSVQGFLTSFLD